MNSAAIQQAKDHESRVKMHTKAVDQRDKAGDYFPMFLNWVRNGIRLPDDKADVFEGMCQFPLPTNALCGSIFEEYEKIFTAQDAYFDAELLDDTMRTEFKAYLEKIGLRKYFHNVAFKAYQKQPACLYVVDLPAVQTTLRPEPFVYKVAISHVVDIDISFGRDGQQRIDTVIFKKGKGTYIQIDELVYRVFRKEDQGEELMLMGESFHGLGYCPATFLCRPLYDEEDKSPVARKARVSDELSTLDWLLFYKIAERMYETYGPFPIITVPETKCDYTDNLKNRCQNGAIAIIKENGQPSWYDCPVCKKNSLVGGGTVFTRPVPRRSEDAQLIEAVTITPPDIPSLEHISKKIDYLEWEVYSNCVGSNDEMVTKEAVNESQNQNIVEGKRNVLASVRKEFEACEQFIVDTMGRLMYGDYYVASTITYGEQVLLYTATDVTTQYTEFKKAGLPVFMIAQKKKLLLQTEFKNNPYEQRRSELLNMLEPWPDLSIVECMTYGLARSSPEIFALKLNFANFVSIFEQANGDIVAWGSLLSLEQKIFRLTKILHDYVKQTGITPTFEERAPAAV